MGKEEMKTIAKAFANGFGYTCAATSTLVFAFPKLAKAAAPTWARVITGLAGTAWTVWVTCQIQKQLCEEPQLNLLNEEEIEFLNAIFKEDEAV